MESFRGAHQRWKRFGDVLQTCAAQLLAEPQLRQIHYKCLRSRTSMLPMLARYATISFLSSHASCFIVDANSLHTSTGVDSPRSVLKRSMSPTWRRATLSAKICVTHFAESVWCGRLNQYRVSVAFRTTRMGKSSRKAHRSLYVYASNGWLDVAFRITVQLWTSVMMNSGLMSEVIPKNWHVHISSIFVSKYSVSLFARKREWWKVCFEDKTKTQGTSK